jgi:hypothetical protein
MSGWAWFLTGAVVVAAATIWLHVARGSVGRGRFSVLRVGLGAAVTLTALAGGSLLTEVRSVAPPEQRGVGVMVDGVQARGARGLDVGLTLGAAVRVEGCGQSVDVRLTVTPTAEFWIDNGERLQRSARVRLAIPDVGLKHLRVSSPTDGLTLVTPLTEDEGPLEHPLQADVEERGPSTLVDVQVPHWGRTQRPLVATFSADWTERRSWLGACYVRLPALAGFPTVLSAAELTGAATDEDSPPGGDLGFFVVSSEETGLHTYYDPTLEVTRGVTSLTLGRYTLQEGATIPGPDSNLGGSPAWTCRTSIADSLGRADQLKPGSQAPDMVLGDPNDSTLAFSHERIDEILDQQTCASFVAIEGPGAGTKRDLALMGVGAMFSLGIELLLSGVRRRREEDGSSRDPEPVRPPEPPRRTRPNARAARTRGRSS